MIAFRRFAIVYVLNGVFRSAFITPSHSCNRVPMLHGWGIFMWHSKSGSLAREKSWAGSEGSVQPSDDKVNELELPLVWKQTRRNDAVHRVAY